MTSLNLETEVQNKSLINVIISVMMQMNHLIKSPKETVQIDS